ncbi:MAG: hypothetical protein AABY22_09875 [Nanoarchaeota archaeon]
MKKVIEICGIDTSGKTTQTNRLMEILSLNGFNPQIIPKTLLLNPKVPRNFEERKKWYEQGNLDDVIFARLQSSREKAKIIDSINDGVIIQDRGYISSYSSCIAYCMQREDWDFHEANRYVTRQNQNVKCFPVEDLHCLLRINRDIGQVVKQRRKEEITDNFLKYLKCFSLSLDNISSRFSNIIKIDACLPKEDISQKIYTILRRLLDYEK